MNEYRATVASIYPEGCPGHKDPRARQGYYVLAENIMDASIKAFHMIRSSHPNVKASECDIVLWKENFF